ncbi:ankyrin repeat-containing domain protein [Phaeosphaeriaceae sp. PMI808]|nr:ankyrin repeat-containing domain protein [Phaeosphaeriaceae sp. PMI808]
MSTPSRYSRLSSPPDFWATAADIASGPSGYLTETIDDEIGNAVDLSSMPLLSGAEGLVNELHPSSVYGSKTLPHDVGSMAISEMSHVAKPVQSRPRCQQDWEAKRTIIIQLYWNENKDLPEVMNVMKEQHGFLATERQYKSQFKRWKLGKNFKTAEAMWMVQTQERRLEEGGKRTVFKLRKRPVDQKKLDRYAKRLKTGNPEHCLDSLALMPSDISYYTPSEGSAPKAQSAESPQPILQDSSIALYPASPILATHLNMDPGTTDLWSPDLLFDGFDFSSFSDAEPQSLGYVLDCAQVPFGSGLFAMLWPNMPWFRFQRIIEISPHVSYAHPQLPSSHSINDLEMEEEPQIISVLVNSELSLDEALASKKLASIFEQAIPEHFDGEFRQKLQKPLNTSGGSRTAQLVELSLGLISNNAMPEEGVQLFLDSIVKYNQKSFLRKMFDVDTPTVQAVSTKILDTVAKDGDKSALDFLLDAGIDRSNLSGARGGRLLQIAVHVGTPEVAKVLVQNGADVNPKLGEFDDKYEEAFELPPLHHAVHKNELELVSYLLEAGAQVDCFGERFTETALSYAVKLKRLECVLLLLNAGANVDTCEDISHYPWCIVRATEGVQKPKAYLKDRPQTVGRRRKAVLEEALIHSHYFYGHEEAVDTLLDFGVDPNVPTYMIKVESPLLYAIPKGVSNVERLLEAGADINGQSVIRAAVTETRSLEILSLLIEKGAKLDLFGHEALEIAIITKNLDAVKLLRNPGSGSQEIMEYFLRHDVDPNIPPDVKGYTTLHYAAYRTSFDMVKLLIDWDDEIIAKSERQARVILLEICARKGRVTSLSREAQEDFKFLLERGASIKGPRPGRRPENWHPVLSSLIEGSAEYELILRVLNKRERGRKRPQCLYTDSSRSSS